MGANKFKVGDVVKCVDNDGFDDRLMIGKEYLVIEADSDNIIIINDDMNKGVCYYSYRFELSDGSDLSPQPPKFKEGDMVYLIGFNCLKTHKLLAKVDNDSPMKFKVEVTNDVFETFTEDGKYLTIDTTPSIVLATEDNRKMLNKLFGVEYEPVKLTGSDLAKKLLKDKPQTCWVSDVSDIYAVLNSSVTLVMKFENGIFTSKSGTEWKFAVPCNQHGNVLGDE